MGCGASTPASAPGGGGKDAGGEAPTSGRAQGDPPPACTEGKQGVDQPPPNKSPPASGLPGSRSKKDLAKLLLMATLPVGWEAMLDPSTDEVYYVNHVEGTTQWEKPPTEEGGEGSEALTRWECKIDPDSGAAYWEDHVTKTTTWQKPIF